MNFYERSGTFAALDLGTTNCRLLIARPSGSEGIRVIDSFSRIVRLGEGLDRTGYLSESAMCRTIDALGSCATKLRHRNVTNARFVATEACRRARNCGDFVDRVYERTGLELEIIQTGEEARLALAGCAPLLDPRLRHAVVFDIGGGSTEVIWVAVRPGPGGRAVTEIRAVLSVSHGVVSLTEHFQDRPMSIATYREMVGFVRGFFRDFDESWGISRRVARGGVQMLGSSGTVTTLAGIHFGLPRYDRARIDGATLDFPTIRGVIDQLISTDAAGLARQPCIGAGRADLMIAGCAILDAICATWPVGWLRVADRGVREGILAGLMADAHRERRRDLAREVAVVAAE